MNSKYSREMNEAESPSIQACLEVHGTNVMKDGELVASCPTIELARQVALGLTLLRKSTTPISSIDDEDMDEDGFSKEQQDQYFDEGKCPYCGASDIRIEVSWDIADDSSARQRGAWCESCEKQWYEFQYRGCCRYLTEDDELVTLNASYDSMAEEKHEA